MFGNLSAIDIIVTIYPVLDSSIFHVGAGGWEMHRWIILKSVIVLLSWVFGYFAIAQLPLTIVGPINATRPVMTLVRCYACLWRTIEIAWQLDWCQSGYYFPVSIGKER